MTSASTIDISAPVTCCDRGRRRSEAARHTDSRYRGCRPGGPASIACSASYPVQLRRTEMAMPIKRELRWFYPIDWPEISRRIRFEPRGQRLRRLRAATCRNRPLSCPTAAGSTRPATPGAMVVAGPRDGRSSSRPCRCARPASSWPRRISIMIRQQSAAQPEEPLPALPSDPRSATSPGASSDHVFCYAAPSVICSWARNPLSVILPNAATTASARARDRHGVPGVIRAARRPRARRAAAHFGAAGLDRAAQHGLEVVVP